MRAAYRLARSKYHRRNRHCSPDAIFADNTVFSTPSDLYIGLSCHRRRGIRIAVNKGGANENPHIRFGAHRAGRLHAVRWRKKSAFIAWVCTPYAILWVRVPRARNALTGANRLPGCQRPKEKRPSPAAGDGLSGLGGKSAAPGEGIPELLAERQSPLGRGDGQKLAQGGICRNYT